MSVATFTPYQPSRRLDARVMRRLTPRMARRDVAVTLNRPVVSFTFDDVPDTVLDNALPLLEAEGWAATLYVATGLMGKTNHLGRMMDREQVMAAADAGHEIAAHTHLHADLTQMSPAEVDVDLGHSHAVFRSMDLPAPMSFAYPYGETRAPLKDRLSKRYGSMRGIAPHTHDSVVDLNQLGSYPLFTGPKLDLLVSALDDLERDGGWMTIFTHDVRDDPSPWGCTPQELSRIINRVVAMDVDVLTVGTCVDRLSHA